ncbi:MAG TPA: hypothetical protein VFY67_13655 [Pyrinomonadaceae bacterium]|nr:hypothetical protein [Pyrinomonadaceae bacterium]
MTDFCAKAVLESIVISANKLNAKNFFMLSLFLSSPEIFALLFPRALSFVFHGIYGRAERFGLLVSDKKKSQAKKQPDFPTQPLLDVVFNSAGVLATAG